MPAKSKTNKWISEIYVNSCLQIMTYHLTVLLISATFYSCETRRMMFDVQRQNFIHMELKKSPSALKLKYVESLSTIPIILFWGRSYKNIQLSLVALECFENSSMPVSKTMSPRLLHKLGSYITFFVDVCIQNFHFGSIVIEPVVPSSMPCLLCTE